MALCHIWHVPEHAAPPALRSWCGISKAPEGVAYVPAAHLMPGLCLMMLITVALNDMETSAEELRSDQSVEIQTLSEGTQGLSHPRGFHHGRIKQS